MNPVIERVLYEDGDILAVEKPSGMLTTSATSEESLHTRVRAAVGEREIAHPTSRLDRDVSGIVLFARSKRAIEHLKRERSRGAYERVYLGLGGANELKSDKGRWDEPISIDPRDKRRRMVESSSFRGIAPKEASTRYTVLERSETGCALAFEPETGRTHQIRLHTSYAGCPLLGDRLYGGTRRLTHKDGRVLGVDRTMLHCYQVRITRISKDEPICIRSTPPEDFMETAAVVAPGLDCGVLESIFPQEVTEEHVENVR